MFSSKSHRPARRRQPILSSGRIVPVIAAILLTWQALLPGQPLDSAIGLAGGAIASPSVEIDADSAVPGLLGIQATSGTDLCAVSVEAMPLTDARVRLSVDAPCHAGSDVVVAQDGTSVGKRLDVTGRTVVTVAALSESPRLDVAVGDVAPVAIQVWTADYEDVLRAALH